MSFNGSGTFLINTAGQPVVSGTVISSTAFNALTADLATGLSTAITKDGQTTVTANIPMSTYKFTGLGVGSAATDSANLSQVQSTVTKLLNSVSGADTITATASPTLAAYAAGQMFYFVAAGDNTTSVTLNIDSLGAKAVTRDGSVALAAADIKSGEVIVVVYDGTRFQVVSQLNSAGDARFANVSIASSLYVGGVSTFVGNAGFSANVSIASALSVGGVAAITGATTIGGNLTLSGGTANGVLYLNGSKVATSGSALAFDSSDRLIVGAGSAVFGSRIECVANTSGDGLRIRGRVSDGTGIVSFGANAAATEFARIQSDNTSALIFGTGAAGSEAMRLTSTGLGIGTSSPAYKVDVAGQAKTTNGFIVNNGTNAGFFTTDGTNVNFGSSTSAKGLAFFVGASSQAALLDSSGNLGLGVTPSAWGSTWKALQITSWASLGAETSSSGECTLLQNAYASGASTFNYIGSFAATRYTLENSVHKWYTAPSGTAGNTITFTQALTLTSGGILLVGTTTASAGLGAGGLEVTDRIAVGTGSVGTPAIHFVGDSNTGFYTPASDTIGFSTGGSERARITSGGSFLVGTTNTDPVGGNTPGVSMSSGGVLGASADGAAPFVLNRKTNDGILVAFYQDAVQEGNISVSGNTVSYNAFAGSHWSQLQDGSKPDILRGTVMESINELCVWPDETNERLPKSKVSDTAGSKKVYGVFMAWDNDWTATNDMLVTSVGAFICRVNGSVTVQEGDLLESNGDGTARVQADDIIRSSTIGKVTSTVKTHQYADGSYCVPTVLYCG